MVSSLRVARIPSVSQVFFAAVVSSTGNLAPQTGFTAAQTTGPAPLSVRFVDQSWGTITGWFWCFGDGSISTDEFPKHVYTQPGLCTVKLFVTGASGGFLLTKDGFVTVTSDSTTTPTGSPTSTPTMTSTPMGMPTDTPTGEGTLVPRTLLLIVKVTAIGGW